MRLFYGIGLNHQLTTSIGVWRERQLAADGRPVPPANFHVTLAFAGDLPQKSLEYLELTTADCLLSAAAHGTTLCLDQVGYWSKPGILWLGPSRWPDTLETIASALRQQVSKAGGKGDRRVFQPHISLFRNCGKPPANSLQAPSFELFYDTITLYESVKGRRSVHYQPICDWSLASAR